jgi:hypothetical protein
MLTFTGFIQSPPSKPVTPPKSELTMPNVGVGVVTGVADEKATLVAEEKALSDEKAALADDKALKALIRSDSEGVDSVEAEVEGACVGVGVDDVEVEVAAEEEEEEGVEVEV